MSDLRLGYYDRLLYFDFVDISSNRRTLVYDTRTEGWFIDQYTPSVVVHAGEEGRGLNSLLLGGTNGKVYQASGSANDDGTSISCLVLTRSLVQHPAHHRLRRGSDFDVNWAPGSVINIDGVDHILYRQPTSTTRLETVENVGTKTAVSFRLEQPPLLGQPMPVMWGPLAGETAVFLCACGDPFQPGVVFITKGNDPDSAPPKR